MSKTNKNENDLERGLEFDNRQPLLSEIKQEMNFPAEKQPCAAVKQGIPTRNSVIKPDQFPRTAKLLQRSASVLQEPKLRLKNPMKTTSQSYSSCTAGFEKSISVPTESAAEAKSIICAITSGLSKDGSIRLVPGKELKLRLFLWSKDVRTHPLNLDKLSCYFTNTELLDKGHPSVKLKPLRADTLEVILIAPQALTTQLCIEYMDTPVRGSPYKVIACIPAAREEALRESLFSQGFSIVSKTGRPLSRRSTPDSQKLPSLGRVSVLDEEDFLIMNIGSFGREPGQFLNPQGVCITDTGEIAVTDSSVGCVQVFDSDGRFKRRIGERGRKPGQIFRPTGIAFLPEHVSRFGKAAFVVADYENRTVVIFDLDGKFLTTFGSAKLTGPKGVAVATNGDILVVDNRSNSVFVFRGGKMFKKIWSPSSFAARLAGPHYISVRAENGDIVISDFHHHTIKIFNSDYIYQYSFGGFNPDGGMGSFSGPTGVAADHRGITVCDWGTGYIQIFDHSGSFVAYVTNLNNPLYGPQGLAVAADGTIYAADSGNHTVRVYRHPLT